MAEGLPIPSQMKSKGDVVLAEPPFEVLLDFFPADGRRVLFTQAGGEDEDLEIEVAQHAAEFKTFREQLSVVRVADPAFGFGEDTVEIDSNTVSCHGKDSWKKTSRVRLYAARHKQGC